MIKKILYIIFIFLSLNLSGQDSKWYFSLNMGKAWPIGAFSQTSLNQLDKGFAKNGFALSLESNYVINDNFSLKGMALLNTNTVNRLPLWNNLYDRLSKSVPISGPDVQYVALNVNPWVTNSLLVGPVYTFILKNLKWDLYGTAGLSVIYLPQPQLTYQNPSSNDVFINRTIKPRSVYYGVSSGSSLRYPISDRFDFRIGLNYFYSKATQRSEQVKITTTQTNTVVQQLSTASETVPINIISATVGLVYYLK